MINTRIAVNLVILNMNQMDEKDSLDRLERTDKLQVFRRAFRIQEMKSVDFIRKLNLKDVSPTGTQFVYPSCPVCVRRQPHSTDPLCVRLQLRAAN